MAAGRSLRSGVSGSASVQMMARPQAFEAGITERRGCDTVVVYTGNVLDAAGESGYHVRVGIIPLLLPGG